MVLVGVDVLDHPAVVLIPVTALHGLDITAALGRVGVGEVVLAVVVAALDVEALGRPLVPPGQGHELGTEIEGAVPLGIPEQAADTAVGGVRRHIGLLGGHAHADLLRLPRGVLGAVLGVVEVEEVPLALFDAGGTVQKTSHATDGVLGGSGVGLVVVVGGQQEGLLVPVNEAIGPLLLSIVVVIVSLFI